VAVAQWHLHNGQITQNIYGHYGPQLVAYILHQYYGCRVTEPLLFAQLKEIGVEISEGQLSNILIQGKELFHSEKDELLPAGIIATGQVKVDDTGARHQGQNGYSTIIGNEFFTSIVSTESKSRVNFLKILHGANPRYLINNDAADYIETLKPSNWLVGYLLLHDRERSMDAVELAKFLLEVNITAEGEIRLVTEAALFASLIENGIPRTLECMGTMLANSMPLCGHSVGSTRRGIIENSFHLMMMHVKQLSKFAENSGSIQRTTRLQDNAF